MSTAGREEKRELQQARAFIVAGIEKLTEAMRLANPDHDLGEAARAALDEAVAVSWEADGLLNDLGDEVYFGFSPQTMDDYFNPEEES